MKYEGVCIAVKNVNLSKKFYQDLFDLEIFQDYGINVSFGGLSLQQEFDWLTGVPKESILEKAHNMELYFEEDDFEELLSFFPHPANTLPAITTAIAHAAAFFQIPFLIIQVSFPSFPLSVSLFPSMGQLGFLQKE